MANFEKESQERRPAQEPEEQADRRLSSGTPAADAKAGYTDPVSGYREQATAPEEPVAAQVKSADSKPIAGRLTGLEGIPARVLSTSLGIALLANALLLPVTGSSAAEGDSSADEPKLVSWSTDEVKAYFDQNADWSIPLPDADKEDEGSASGDNGSGTDNGASGGTTVINNYGGYGSGFGWDDLLLYHFLFNSGSNYSTRTWYDNHRGYYTGTSRTYTPRTFSGETFQNKQMPGSAVKPKTSTSTTGSITRRSTSSKAGGIGGKSSSLGSSSSSSGSSSSSSGKSGGGKGFFGG